MFDMPVEPADLAEADDAAVITAITGWKRVAAAAEARKLAAIAELTRRREPAEHPDWACDDWDATAAEIAAALNTGHGRALGQLELATTLRDRLPRVGALMMDGQLSARTVAVIATRTALITDPDTLTRLDAKVAERAASWEALSEANLKARVDFWVDTLDPGAVRQNRARAQNRDIHIGDPQDADRATTSIAGRLLSPDAALLDQRLTAMARGVCLEDPRTLAQRRADALGALAAHATHLACRCESPHCPAATDDGRASSVVVHVVAQTTTTTADPDPLLHGEHSPAADTATPPTPPPGLILGGGIIPAPLLAELIAHGAKTRQVTTPGPAAEPRYRPGTALDEFVRTRDLTCRFPGCNCPAIHTDLDHTTPWPAGNTHAGNLKNYCRLHHLLKTFWPDWTEHQLRDGTLNITTPTGHTYTTSPGAALLFPAWNITTPAPSATAASSASANPPHPGRTLMMPRRKRTRAQARAYRIAAERALNDAHVAERNRPPPF
ncbi:HNH endonuclease signature motif containing protein [Mycolicibacterium palauense]|uniref:HNH endonuclease signature motif containing protein n=1 Tax=Mycolicibacterium palauense TaxID=2034511 RepID=UPI001C3F4D00|nr:HNH endonuclease signature motif containing protein [Mycolicibacterium palauense]